MRVRVDQLPPPPAEVVVTLTIEEAHELRRLLGYVPASVPGGYSGINLCVMLESALRDAGE